jgi:hypothetical protein
MLLLRGLLLTALGMWHVQAVLLYVVAYTLFLHVLDFFDAFHHTFEQHFVEADEAIPKGRTHAYEQANTYSNLVSPRAARYALVPSACSAQEPLRRPHTGGDAGEVPAAHLACPQGRALRRG